MSNWCDDGTRFLSLECAIKQREKSICWRVDALTIPFGFARTCRHDFIREFLVELRSTLEDVEAPVLADRM